MTDTTLTLSIRAKKIGVLLRDARLHSKKSVEECAQAIGVEPERIEQYETGQQNPSLPELEILAYYLNIPLDHFWGDRTLHHPAEEDHKFKPQQLIQLRQRIVGAQLRQARVAGGLSLEELALKSGIDPQKLQSYELGEEPIPLPALELIAANLERSYRDFQDVKGPVGVWAAQQRTLKALKDMPPDLQIFGSKPINRPYLELAKRLSEMSVEKLRAVAEGLLEITL
jgi:transcriptional regulator with XRE-family HTH domain